ncbi:MAG TPA: CPBP family intramembrane glutamic endopeptidase [Candidatus Polarisedimenticolia bacterium]|nr:CPBP family intramembrane glutamic endopeptidase [Candidatus Polarisedimenticolia bacterium]
MPGAPSLLFLAYLLGVLPWAAIRSARRVEQALGRSGRSPASDRLAIWGSTLVAQGLLLVLAWLAGRGFGFRFFAVALTPAGLVAAAAALGACFVLRAVARALRTEEERKALVVYRLAPRSAVEWLAWGAVALVASVTEEIAYRGVGVAILSHWSGSLAAAILVCATAFAVAHALQGWKSGVVIFMLALIFHALVLFTGTLVLAMLVHLLYDVIAAVAIAREAERDDRAAPPPGQAPVSPEDGMTC